MKIRLPKPVLYFAVIFLALIAVQCYYLYNTAQLWKSEINREVQQRLKQFSKVEFSTNADDISAKALNEYESGKISEQELLKKYVVRERFKDADISKNVDSLFQDEGYKIGLAKEIISVISLKSKKELLTKPVTIFSTKNSAEGGKIINNSEWDTSTKNRQNGETEDYRYYLKDRTFYKILNINEVLTKKLAPQIVLNVLICGLMLYLFSKTLQNVRNQERKISELHTTIDSISHELNTPIATMKFALKSISDSETQSLFSRQISRIESISESVHRKDLDSELLTIESLETYFSELKSRFIDVKIICEHEFVFNKSLTVSDFKLMTDNLIGNSAKYGASEISIETVFENSIKISVKDNGFGIPENEHSVIFNKFYRIPNQKNSEINGLGLGLYLVKQTVQKYSGTVAAISNTGKGVEFKIIIPNQ